jgi:hypothetical protein
VPLEWGASLVIRSGIEIESWRSWKLEVGSWKLEVLLKPGWLRSLALPCTSTVRNIQCIVGPMEELRRRPELDDGGEPAAEIREARMTGRLFCITYLIALWVWVGAQSDTHE